MTAGSLSASCGGRPSSATATTNPARRKSRPAPSVRCRSMPRPTEKRPRIRSITNKKVFSAVRPVLHRPGGTFLRGAGRPVGRQPGISSNCITLLQRFCCTVTKIGIFVTKPLQRLTGGYTTNQRESPRIETLGKPAERLGRKATGPVTWQPAAQKRSRLSGVGSAASILVCSPEPPLSGTGAAPFAYRCADGQGEWVSPRRYGA